MHRKKIMRKQNKQICNKQIEKKIDFSNRQKFTQKKIHGGNFPGSNFPGEGNFPGRQFFEGGEGWWLKPIVSCYRQDQHAETRKKDHRGK